MPIISPNIQAALRKAGIAKESSDIPLPERLDANNLSIDELLCELSNIVQGGDTPQKLRAIDTGLKLHKVLNDQPASIPQISIVIQDKFSVAGAICDINPILIPRPNIVKEVIQ